PPTLTLFPYTTLFRSRKKRDRAKPRMMKDLWRAIARLPLKIGCACAEIQKQIQGANRRRTALLPKLRPRFFQPAPQTYGGDATRSEEHTSELQSLAYL